MERVKRPMMSLTRVRHSTAVVDRVVPELQALNPELVTTNLPAEQEARLRELFAGHQTPA